MEENNNLGGRKIESKKIFKNIIIVLISNIFSVASELPSFTNINWMFSSKPIV